MAVEDSMDFLRFIQNRLDTCERWIEHILCFHPLHRPNGFLPTQFKTLETTKPQLYLLLICLVDSFLTKTSPRHDFDEMSELIRKLVARLAWLARDDDEALAHFIPLLKKQITQESIVRAVKDAEEKGVVYALPSPDEVKVFIKLPKDDPADLENWTWASLIQGDGEPVGIARREKKFGAFIHNRENTDFIKFAYREEFARMGYSDDLEKLWKVTKIDDRTERDKPGQRFENFISEWNHTIGNQQVQIYEKIPVYQESSSSEYFGVLAEFNKVDDSGGEDDADQKALSFVEISLGRHLEIYAEIWGSQLMDSDCPVVSSLVVSPISEIQMKG